MTKSAVTERMEHITAVCSQLAEDVTTLTPSAGTLPRSPSDRSLNIVMFCVAEDRTATVWRHKVDSALRFVAGHDVDVVDMFRIGRYSSQRSDRLL